jgi:hypothetical protein
MLPPHIAECTRPHIAITPLACHSSEMRWRWKMYKLLPRRTTLLVHIIIIWLIIAKESENLGKTENDRCNFTTIRPTTPENCSDCSLTCDWAARDVLSGRSCSLVLGHERPMMRNRKTDIKRIVARTRPECRTFAARGRGHCLHIPTRGRAENVRRCVEVA